MDLKKEFQELKGFSSRNLLYMKQFAQAYPISVLQQFIRLEREIKGMKSISQQAIVKLLDIAYEQDVITQQVAAQLQEEHFLQSIVSRIS